MEKIDKRTKAFKLNQGIVVEEKTNPTPIQSDVTLENTLVNSVKVKRDWSESEDLALPYGTEKKYGKAEVETHYFWCRRVKKMLNKYENWGYNYVMLDESERKVRRPALDSGDESSFVINDDLVLMYIPYEDFKDKKEHDESRVRNSLKYVQGSKGLRDQASAIHPDIRMQEEIVNERL